MSLQFDNTVESRSEYIASTDYPDIIQSARRAIALIAPSWDLHSYVAVNPLSGMEKEQFIDAVKLAQAAHGTSLLPSTQYFKNLYEENYIQKEDLIFAMNQWQESESGRKSNETLLRNLIELFEQEEVRNRELSLLSITDLCDEQLQGTLTTSVVGQITKWLGAYYDKGIAQWGMPGSSMPLFTAWKSLSIYDKGLEPHGISVKDELTRISDCPLETISLLTERLLDVVMLSDEQLTNYFFRLLCSVHGWASYLKHFDYEKQRVGKYHTDTEDVLLDSLLAIRLFYDTCFLHKLSNPQQLSQVLNYSPGDVNDLDLQYIWMQASEQATRRRTLESIYNRKAFQRTKHEAHFVFCIDARSEVLRRHIEAIFPEATTGGFAGFFGLPTTIQRVAEQTAEQHCPVLIEPSITVQEYSADGLPERRKNSTAVKQWIQASLKKSAVSCFSYAETFGWTYILKLIGNTLGISQPLSDTTRLGLSRVHEDAILLDIGSIPYEQKVSLAANALKGMGLSTAPPPYVFLIGHGSSSSNNPHASSLQCGACAGHNGSVNAQLLTLLLNDSEIRKSLGERGIELPDDTVFIHGHHDTTLDIINISYHGSASDKELEFLKKVRLFLAYASECSRREKSNNLSFTKNLTHRPLLNELRNRSRDWSEVRPEWGLARNSSFIIGRRSLTSGSNLDGQSFLHDYDYSSDRDLSRLLGIMTAPVVVAQWINLQYYFSTVAPRTFGAGEKSLLNIIGGFGCIEGNNGDLRIGLSTQSVHYNGSYYHKPVRLQVMVEAPCSAIIEVLERAPEVQPLFDKSWLQLVSIDPVSGSSQLYQPSGWLTLKENIWKQCETTSH